MACRETGDGAAAKTGWKKKEQKGGKSGGAGKDPRRQ